MISGLTDILHYIPQRPPFVFIDTIEAISERACRTLYTIPADCPLVDRGHLTLAGLMENGAQTCAVRGGQTIGYIGAVKAMEVSRFPKVGETIRTEMRVVEEVMNISLIEVHTYLGETQIAECLMKIATT